MTTKASVTYEVGIDIDRPRDEVVALFDDPDNFVKWQQGLQSRELLSGEAGQPGARTKLVFQMGKRRMAMVETITRRDLPDEIEGIYETQGVHNVVKNRFIEVSPNQTKWESENEFRFQGFMKLVGFFFKSAFPKQSMKYLKAFKAFAEDGTDVRESVK